jgi:8-amino-7-oxononanoate synthase
MALFDKCREFSRKVEYIKSLNQFFYLREVDPASTPRVSRHGKKLLMLGSNNYLGLTHHPKVVEATIKALREYGTGACSSRVLTGTTSLHNHLEQRLARFKGTEDAVLFSTGFMAMAGTVSTIAGEGDIILSDELNHASIIEGCRLSKADLKIYRHNDMANLEEMLAACDPARDKLIVTDGVFSMKGSVANLPEIRRLADKHGAAVMVDDAHGSGVLGEHGRGTPEHFGLEGKIEIVCGTFSKSFAAIGGFAGSTRDVGTFLRLNARPFIFSASTPPALCATVLACLDVLETEPELLKKLHRNAGFVKQGLKDAGFVLEETITPIIPVLVRDDEKTFRMAGLLDDDGVIVNPIVPPAVTKGGSLIRVSVMATFSEAELCEAVDKLKKAGRKAGVI